MRYFDDICNLDSSYNFEETSLCRQKMTGLFQHSWYLVSGSVVFDGILYLHRYISWRTCRDVLRDRVIDHLIVFLCPFHHVASLVVNIDKNFSLLVTILAIYGLRRLVDLVGGRRSAWNKKWCFCIHPKKRNNPSVRTIWTSLHRGFARKHKSCNVNKGDIGISDEKTNVKRTRTPIATRMSYEMAGCNFWGPWVQSP